MLKRKFEFLINAFQPLLIRKTYILPLPWDRCLVSQVKTDASGCLNSSANSIAAILRVLAPKPVQELHLVGPLGFEISDRYLKRAGLDYWPYVSGTTILLIPFKLTINNAEAMDRFQRGQL